MVRFIFFFSLSIEGFIGFAAFRFGEIFRFGGDAFLFGSSLISVS